MAIWMIQTRTRLCFGQASAAAEAPLAAVLDTADFRAMWRKYCPHCDPEVLNASGTDLVQYFREEMQFAE